MKNFFKILGIIFGTLIVLIYASYQFFFTKINYDQNIKNNHRIKNLDKKTFWDFGYRKPEKISTDFSLFTNENDTVEYIFRASLNPKYNQIGQFQITSSTGFGGNSVEIYKLGNRFRIEIDDFSDNETENEYRKGYKILSQKLILDKENYKPCDSIFGELQIKFRDNSDNSINETIGFFRGKIN